MMVSFAYFITFCLASIAVRSEDLSTTKDSGVESKWLGWPYGFQYFGGLSLSQASWWPVWSGYYPSCFGATVLGAGYNGYYFAKASDTEALSRRAIALDADHLYPRGSEGAVSCVDEKGDSTYFIRSHCAKAAQQLADKKVSSTSCGTCRLSLVTKKDRVVALNTPGQVLEKAVHGLLETCSKAKNAKQVRRSTHTAEEKQVILLLHKGHGKAC